MEILVKPLVSAPVPVRTPSKQQMLHLASLLSVLGNYFWLTLAPFLAHSFREPERRYPLVNGLCFEKLGKTETRDWEQRRSEGVAWPGGPFPLFCHCETGIRCRALHGHEQEHELWPPAWWLAVGLHMYAP